MTFSRIFSIFLNLFFFDASSFLGNLLGPIERPTQSLPIPMVFGVLKNQHRTDRMKSRDIVVNEWHPEPFRLTINDGHIKPNRSPIKLDEILMDFQRSASERDDVACTCPQLSIETNLNGAIRINNSSSTDGSLPHNVRQPAGLPCVVGGISGLSNIYFSQCSISPWSSTLSFHRKSPKCPFLVSGKSIC